MSPDKMTPTTASSMSMSKVEVSEDNVIFVKSLIPSDTPWTVVMATNCFLISNLRKSATNGEMKSLSAPVSSKALIRIDSPEIG